MTLLEYKDSGQLRTGTAPLRPLCKIHLEIALAKQGNFIIVKFPKDQRSAVRPRASQHLCLFSSTLKFLAL